jgi:hypothetical protein
MSTLRIVTGRGDAATGRASVPPEAADDVHVLEDSPRYCPTRMLATFALLMAGHGRCVNTDMMLGDREYALWQLDCARALDDDELVTVVERLSAYFDDPQHTGMPVLGTA